MKELIEELNRRGYTVTIRTDHKGIFVAEVWHRGVPIHGVGHTAIAAVLTCFPGIQPAS